MYRRTVRLSSLVALPLLFALLTACIVTTTEVPETTPSAIDPGAPGPYPVGVTQIDFERPSSTTDELRVLSTLIWYPAAESARDAAVDEVTKGVRDAELTGDGLPLPVIVFSHGSGGVTWQSTFFTAHLAGHGFVVVAPPHPGNTAADCFPCLETEGLVDSYINRPDDITFALESVLALNDDSASLFYHALDGDRVGISGHSFGGLDAVRMAAEDGPFTAALAMAPAGGGTIPEVVDPVEMPLMIMGGELDRACPVELQRAYFEDLEGDAERYLVIFSRGGHFAYADRCIAALGGCGADDISQEDAHRLVDYYATAFFKTFVAEDESYATFLDSEAHPPDAEVEYQASEP